MVQIHDKWACVTTAWQVLWLRMKEWCPIWRVDANILNKQLWTTNKGWSSSLGGWARCWQLLTIKTGFVMKLEHVPWTWNNTLVWPKKLKRDMLFSTWNVRSLKRSGWLITVARRLARSKLDLAGVRKLDGAKWAL